MYFQDSFAHIHCYGCGVRNAAGLQIKSRWLEEGMRSLCLFQPEAHHCAGPVSCVNGGIIATAIDCHAVCTAMARAYLDEGRSFVSLPVIQYATASLAVTYLCPAAMGRPLRLEASVSEVAGRKTRLAVTVFSAAEPCATAEVLAVRVPADWLP